MPFPAVERLDNPEAWQREAGGQGASVADTMGRVMITLTILRHPGKALWRPHISGLCVRSRLFCHLAFSSRLWFPR